MECTLCFEIPHEGTGCLCCPYTYKDSQEQHIPLVNPQHHASIRDISCSTRVPPSLSSVSSHYICVACLNSYLTVNVLPKVFEVKANFAVIPCPFLGCSQAFHPLELYSLMNTNNRRRYKRILEELLCAGLKGKGGTHVTKKERTFVEAIGAGRRVNTALMDLLTLRCPTCRQAVDPYPDACAAVLCLCCGSYYCNCCLMAFCSGDSAADKAACHLHAASHHPNSHLEDQTQNLTDPFLPHDVILNGHMNYKKVQIWRVLKMVFSHPSSPSGRARRSQKALHASILNVLLLESDLREQTGIKLCDLMQLIQQKSPTDVSTRSDPDPFSSPLYSSSSSSSSSSGFRLMNCIYSLNIEAFRQIINSLPFGSSELEFKCPQTGLTLLALSSSFKQMEMSLELLQRGCSVESAQGPCERSLLYVLTEMGDLHLLQAIKAKYPQINLNQIATKERDSHRIIHVASRYGHGHIVAWLCQHGVDINAREEEFGYTALHLACIYDQYFVTAILLSTPGVNYLVHDNNGKLGIHIAAERGCVEIVRLYMEHAMENPPQSIVDVATINEGWSSLHIAAHFKQAHIVKLLIEHGASVHLKDKHLSYPPVLFALLSGCVPSALSLMEAMGEKINEVKDNLGRTVLHLACKENMIDVIAVLQGPILLQEDVEYRLPIYYCIEGGFLTSMNKVISLYLSLASDNVDHVNSICWRAEDKMWYPVHVAAALDRSDILFELIRIHNADWKVKDAHGKTALDLTIEFDSSASKAVLNFFEFNSRGT